MPFKKLPYAQCDLCKNKKGPNPGFYYVDIDVDGRQYKGVMECECHIKWTKDNRILIGAAKNNLWNDPPFWAYDLAKNYKGVGRDFLYRQIWPFIEYAPNTERSFYFLGKSATQKTTVAQWVGLCFLKKGLTAHYESMQGLITNLVPATFEDSARAKVYSDKCLNVDVSDHRQCFRKREMFHPGMAAALHGVFLQGPYGDKKKSVILVVVPCRMT